MSAPGGIGGLRRFVAAPKAGANGLPFEFRARKTAPGEACEMCAESITAEHAHVVNVESRRLLCTCRPCYLLFTQDGAGRGAYRSVPDRYRTDPEFSLGDGDWEQLQVPVSVAFFFHNSVLGRVVAHYPSPAGATESLLDLAAWAAIAAASPLAAALAPDVEAIVVHRARPGSDEVNEVFLVPIDVCYELVGRLRMHWTGFDGGPEARRDLAAFFDLLRTRSRPLTATERAAAGTVPASVPAHAPRAAAAAAERG